MYSVVLIRHCESRFNRYGELDKDAKLTEEGKIMAKELKGNFDLIICSNLTRAKETLLHSNLVAGEIVFTDLCREFRHGNLADYLPGETSKEENNSNLILADETQEMFDNRLNLFKQEIRNYSKKYNNIAVITHHGVIYRLTGYNVHNCGSINYKFY